MRDAGLQVVLFNAPPGDWTAGERGLASLPARRKDFRAAMGRAFEYAAALNCPRIHVVAGVEPAQADRRAMEACYMDNLAWAAEQASGAGLLLLIEPINRRDIPGFFLSDFDFAQKVLEDIGAPNLRLQFDIYHAQIMDGDYVIIKRAREAQKGQIVVAQTNDGEATLKRWYPEANRIRLEPANRSMQSIYVKDAKVLGVLIGVVRNMA